MQVSVLLAVRNEAPNLLRCLAAIDAAVTTWACPVEVLIGDDQSTDGTGALAQQFIGQLLAPRQAVYRVLPMQPAQGNAQAKANVIKQLAAVAQGELLLITDADTAVPPTWIGQMVAAFGPRTGIVTGFTALEGAGLLARLQAVDWLVALGQVQLAAWLGLPLCSLGSNMAYRRAAYQQVGGYEALPFSVTEDLVLFQAMVGQGWGFCQLSHPGIVARGRALTHGRALLRQRQRWFAGAWQLLAWPWLVLLLANGLLGLWLWPLGWGLGWPWAVGVWLGRFGFQSLVAGFFAVRTHQAHLLPFLPVYEAYVLIFNPIVFVYFWLSRQMWWKDRDLKRPSG
ncbi:MAG: glycosyltransferase [Bernardetiaceae bacterium]|nr:glycosyltransferase [Bernardetiaceae bacterium]